MEYLSKSSSIEKQFISLPFGRICYYQYGKGSPVLLIHGINWGSWTWERVLELIGANYSVYSFDLPGSFYSDTPKDWTVLSHFSDGIVDFMDALGIDGAHLIGRAAGAVISIDLAVRYPNKFSKIVLNSCPTWTRNEGLDRFKKRRAADLVTKPITLVELRALMPDGDQRVADLYNEGRRDIAWMVNSHHVICDHDITSQLQHITQPTLLLQGDGDDIHGPHIRGSREILRSNIRDVKIIDLPGGSYIPPFEEPEAFSQTVIDFFEQ